MSRPHNNWRAGDDCAGPVGDHVEVSGKQHMTPPRPSTGSGGKVRLARHLGILLLVLSALGYLGWLLEFVLPTGLSPWQSYVSELSADGRPYRDLFLGIDFATGVCALAASPLLARLVPAQVMARLTVLAIAMFGAIMLLRGMLTLDCAPSLEASCVSRADDGTLSAAHQARWVLVGAVSVLYLLGVVTAERWFARGVWRNLLRCAFVLGAACSIAILVLGGLGPGHLVGIAVRAQMLVHAGTLLVGAVYLMKSSSTSHTDNRGY